MEVLRRLEALREIGDLGLEVLDMLKCLRPLGSLRPLEGQRGLETMRRFKSGNGLYRWIELLIVLKGSVVFVRSEGLVELTSL